MLPDNIDEKRLNFFIRFLIECVYQVRENTVVGLQKSKERSFAVSLLKLLKTFGYLGYMG
jgi:hypothetical protein